MPSYAFPGINFLEPGMTDTRAHNFIIAAELTALRLELERLGVPESDAKRIVGAAFGIGWNGCADDLTRRMEAA